MDKEMEKLFESLSKAMIEVLYDYMLTTGSTEKETESFIRGFSAYLEQQNEEKE